MRPHPRVEEVALFAILLREAARHRHLDRDAHLDDIICGPDSLSMATLAAGGYFGEKEWRLAELLYYAAGWQVVYAAEELQANADYLRAEAVLHAYGDRGKRTRATWAQPYIERWSKVRASISALETEGLSETFGDLTRGAERSYRQITGMSWEEMDEQFPPDDTDPWNEELLELLERYE